MARSPINKHTFPLRIAGKHVCFAGSVCRYTHERFAQFLQAEGVRIIDEVSPSLDFLVLGKTRFASQQKMADRLNQERKAKITILDEEQLRKLVIPTLDEVLEMLRAGELGIKRYNVFADIYFFEGDMPDLSGQDLRNLDLRGWQPPQMRDMDLRGANLSDIKRLYLKSSRLDEAVVHNTWLDQVKECSATDVDFSTAATVPFDFLGFDLRRSTFRNVWLSNCVFTGAKLDNIDFRGANLTGADFTGLILKKIDFTQATLAGAKFKDADLRGTRFVRTDLTNADFTDANVAKADFTGASLEGATLDGVDVSMAIGLRATPLASRAKIGSAVQEWLRLGLSAPQLTTTITLIDGAKQVKASHLASGGNFSARDEEGGSWSGGTAELSLTQLANRWHKATPMPATVSVAWSGSGVTAKVLTPLATSMWCELFGVPAPSNDELKQLKREQLDAWVNMLRNDPKGIEKWRREWFAITPGWVRRTQIAFHELDLAHAKLTEWYCAGMDFRRSSLAGADLRRSNFVGSNFTEADFTGADLRSANMTEILLKNARCCKADFSAAYLNRADVCGADFTGAILKDTNVLGAKYDEHTRFPRSFTPTPEMKWKGKGSSPAFAAPVAKRKSSTPMDVGTFLKRLETEVEVGKLAKALAMLKADRFKLYAQVTPEFLVGVVKSQSDPELVYSCRLNSDGSYACCTQNLNICGGLRGSLCKHLLVLIVGLSKAGDFDLAEVDSWIAASRAQKPALDKEAMSETFLRYKGAEAGEVDWRPTETIPEDYYAL